MIDELTDDDLVDSQYSRAEAYLPPGEEPAQRINGKSASAASGQYRRDFDRAKSAVEPLKLIEPETWQDQPVPHTRWLVEGVIPAGAVCTLGGHGETGKSLLALQLGVARAIGRDWLGFPTAAGKTIVVSCEDPAEQIHIRLAGILRQFGANFKDLGDRLRIIDRNDLLNAFMTWETRSDQGGETPFYRQVIDLAIDLMTDLVVIDSRYDIFPGEQNDSVQVHQFMSALRVLAGEINGAVLLLSHPSRAGLDSGDGESGSVAWHNKVRSRIYLKKAEPERDGDVDRILEHLKSNWGPKFEPLPLRWENGAYVADRPAGGVIGAIVKGTDEQMFLAALDALDKQKRDVSDRPTAANFAPKTMLGTKAAGGLSRRRLEAAMKRLFDAGEIIIETYGPPSRSHKRIVRKPSGDAS